MEWFGNLFKWIGVGYFLKFYVWKFEVISIILVWFFVLDGILFSVCFIYFIFVKVEYGILKMEGWGFFFVVIVGIL